MAAARLLIRSPLGRWMARRARRRALGAAGRLAAASAASAVVAVGVISAVRRRRRQRRPDRLAVRRMADAVRRSVPIQITIGDGARPALRKGRRQRGPGLAMSLARTAGAAAGSAAAARIFIRMSRRS
jgi:hypothetical protein